MKSRRFGSTDLVVSELGFGCARLGGFFQGGRRAEMVSLLRSVYDQGITFFDTSDMYTQGESERLLGQAFGGNRSAVVIATKAGYVLPAQRRLASRLKPVLRPLIRRARLTRARVPVGLRGSLSQDFSSAHILHAVEQSLRRLRTDHIDVFQLHSPPADVVRSGDFLDPMQRLKEQGKVRYYGVSCETTADAVACLRFPEISCLQVRLNLIDRSALWEALPGAAGRGLAVIARECYGGGVLAKSIGARQPGDGTSPDHWDGLLEIERLALHLGRPLPQLALQFVLAHPGVSVTLLGMRSREQLEANLVHHAAPPLGDEEMRVLPVPAVGSQTSLTTRSFASSG